MAQSIKMFNILRQEKDAYLIYFYLLVIITGVATFLRFNGLGDMSLWGDELNSLRWAKEPLKSHSYLYYIFLHFWAPVSESVLWYRIPSAIFGALGVISVYYLIKEMNDRRAAILTALLLALNAFHIGYSQEVRFYSLYLLNSLTCIFFLFRFLRTHGKWDLIGWCLFGLLTVASHRVGVLVLGICAFIWLAENTHISRKNKIRLFGGCILTSVILLLTSYLTQAEIFPHLFFFNIGAESRGFTLTSIAKIPLSFYFFFMGESAYPGDVLWLIFCILVFGFLSLRGFYLEFKNQKFLRIFFLIIMPVVFLFLVLDAIVPESFPGAEPKYVIFVLPFLLYLIARGCFFKKQLVTAAFICLACLISFGNLISHYSNEYNHNNYKLIDYEGLKGFVLKHRASGAIYFSDTGESIIQFFPWESEANDVWTLFSRWQERKTVLPEKWSGEKILIKISKVYGRDLRSWNEFFDALQSDYLLEDCFHSHGAQAFLFRPNPGGLSRISKNGEVLFPTHVYSLPYDDLYVTQCESGKGYHFELNPEAEKTIKLIPGQAARGIEVYAHLIGASINTGEKVGSLVITDEEGEQKEFHFVYGVNIGDWKINLVNGKISQEHFKKKIHLFGRAHYPDVYRDFDVKTHKAMFDLTEARVLKSLQFKLNLHKGKMVIWGIELIY